MPPTLLRIKRSDYQVLISHLQSSCPMEACGLLAGKDSEITHVYPIENILKSPIAFEMAPEQQIKSMLDIERKCLNLLAIYHSHPHGPQVPSETDIGRAYYPDAANLIISFREPTKPVARAFTIIDTQVNEIPFIIE